MPFIISSASILEWLLKNDLLEILVCNVRVYFSTIEVHLSTTCFMLK